MQEAGFTDIIEKLANRDNSQPGDYIKDGILMCGKCHTPKQGYHRLPVRPFELDEKGNVRMAVRLVPIVCQCGLAEQEREREHDRQLQFEMWMDQQSHLYGISGGVSKSAVFEADDGRDAVALKKCVRYVETWPQMRENNIGILFCGANSKERVSTRK